MTRIIVRTANIISSSVFFIISLSLFVSLYALLVITPMALYLIFSIIIDLVYSFLGISKHAVQQFPGAFKMVFFRDGDFVDRLNIGEILTWDQIQ